jgi:hypothetical protein
MAIYIKGIKYHTRLSQDKYSLLNALLNLPYPNVVAKKNAKIVTALEAEVVSCSDQESVELGTENVCECIALYLYGGGQRLLIHVNDKIASLDLDTRLAGFPPGEQIHAVLVGGTSVTDDDSNANLSRILSLLEVSKRDIHIVSQKLFDRDITKTTPVLEPIFTHFIVRAQLLWRHLFDEDIPAEFLCTFNPLQFNLDCELIPGAESPLQYFIHTLFMMNPLLDPQQEQHFRTYKDAINANDKPKDVVMLLLRLTVMLPGLKQLAMLNIVGSHINKIDICDFYFHHDDAGEVMIGRMVPGFSIPFDAERRAYVYQKNRNNTVHHYFDAYKDGQYHMPTLSEAFKRSLLELKPMMHGRVMTPDVITAIESASTASSIYHMHILAKAVMDYTPPAVSDKVTYLYPAVLSGHSNHNHVENTIQSKTQNVRK